jgi:hypothetical protein
MRGGKDYDSTFGVRMRGTGPIADLIERRFRIACKRLGLNTDRIDQRMQADPVPEPAKPQPVVDPQMSLFD